MFMNRPVYDPSKESLYQIAGDVPDPSGRDPHLRGQQSTMDFTQGAMAKPLIRWRDFVIEADVYRIDGKLVVHIICPKCSTPEKPHGLYIREDQKALEWDEERRVLSVAPFECSWELPEGRRQEFGIGMCRWRVAIEKNFCREV